MDKRISIINCGKSIENLICVTENPKTFEKFEISFSVPNLNGNFYDESENEVYAEFSDNNGDSFLMPGFYFEPYEFEKTGELKCRSDEPASWRIRATFKKSGDWHIKITVKSFGKLLDTASLDVIVADGDNTRGFIAVEPTVRRNFIFENGELYIPIGENICWHRPVSAKEKQARYINRIINSGNDYGMNFARLWMMYWGLAIKTQNCAPNDFSAGQSNAAQLDKIVENMEKRGVYASLVFFTHGDFSTTADAHWYECPYNAVNPHGYLEKPVEFWRNERARKDAKSYIRYLIARYGYSTSIMTWELFNEADNVDNRDFEATAEWHEYMTDYIRSIDPYKHLIATSACYADGKIARHECLDFTFIHCYNYPNLDWALDFQRRDWKNQKRPAFFGEFGFMGYRPNIKESLIAPHMGNWAGIMGGSAATAMTWWWEQFDDADGYSLYKPVSDFAKRIAWLSPNLTLLTSKNFNSNNNQVKVIGYADGGDAYLWFYDDKLSADKENYTDFPDYKFHYPAENGEYRIEWISTRKGTTVFDEIIKVKDGVLSAKAPYFKGDIAAVIERR